MISRVVIPPEWQTTMDILSDTAPRTTLSLVGAAALLYLELLALRRNRVALYVFTAASAAAWFGLPYYAPFRCHVLDSLLRLCCGCAGMKSIEMFVRRDNPPVCHYPMSNAAYAFYLLWELRFESFNISTVRSPPYAVDEAKEYLIHVAAFAVLQMLPQHDVVKALSVLVSIYVLWTTMNFFLRYPNSPPLFGPLWRATDLVSFWSETWHNAFSSPCHALGYKLFRPMGRLYGVVAAFLLMGIWHAWALAPILPTPGMFRVCCFFVLQALGCSLDATVFGHTHSRLRSLLSWIFCLSSATWTVKELHIPDGVWEIDWRNICRESAL